MQSPMKFLITFFASSSELNFDTSSPSKGVVSTTKVLAREALCVVADIESLGLGELFLEGYFTHSAEDELQTGV